MTTKSPYRTRPTPIVLTRDVQIMDYPVMSKGTPGIMTAFYPRTSARRSEVRVAIEGCVYLLDGDSVDVCEL